jgi:putative membrane protein
MSPTSTQSTYSSPTGTPRVVDSSFLIQALTAGRKEVADSARAVDSTRNARLKSTAQDLVKDHTSANSELEAMATSRHVVVAEHAQDAQKPAASYSDRAYVQHQLDAHRQAIKLFEHESTSGQDPDVKAFAAKTLPTLREHLSMLEKVSKETG